MPTENYYQDPPLEPLDYFLSGKVETSHSAAYCTNEFSLRGASELRIGVRWGFSNQIDYESRDYKCRYVELPFWDPIELVSELKKSAIEVYGKDFHNHILEQMKIYLNSPADLNIEKDWNDLPQYDEENFPFACQLVLLLALENKDEWNSETLISQINRCYKKGHEGIHLEIVWFQYDDPEQFEIRLLNSWENEPQYIYPSGETRGTIVPKVLFSFTQEFE